MNDQVLNGNVSYLGLYKAGAVAAVLSAVIFRRNLDAEFMLMRGIGIINTGPGTPPSTVTGWFLLIQQNRLIGLTLLNLFDLVNYALVGLIFLALVAALWRISPSWIAVAAAVGFSGITVYFASNQAFSMLSLSNQYTAAATNSQRAILLAEGQAALALHHNASYAGPGIYISYLLVSVSGLILSLVMRHSPSFSKVTAWMGTLANAIGISYYVVLALTPAFVFIPISVSAIFLLIWYLLVGRRLWALSSNKN
jgi:hypothetical protein